ncbi:aminotransferase class IV family protein [Pseudofrankia sp. BMG5.37]|uniref:aminotransferase class IV family protein n=1 Tax=Pseudofrankia sp. BMG5.37 TaxID=3050035 RepID=UPI002896139E|nr:aminotransferase class IV family protein [Pseudofrankia sp. BMG5.37]MDT3441382.1 aminotransferase class IV family protein [Pseudofrankia sp. BMG5.37]
MAELDGVAIDVDQLEALALVNYGHFTSMEVADGRVRGLSLHLERLVRDCRQLFDAELDPDRVRHLIRRAMAGTTAPVVVRVTVFDPDLRLGRLGADAVPRLLVTTRPAPRPAAAAAPPGLRLRSACYRRDLPEVKHVGLFGALRLRRAAQRAGYDDAVFTDAGGVLSEATTSNLGFVTGGRVLWPSAECLPGVTMRLIDQELGADATTTAVTLADLPHLDGAFATNAATGVRPVAAIDDVRWPGDHPFTRALARRYEAIPPEPL